MTIFKTALRIWITITSVVGFLAGWVMLAHAPKPKQASVASAPTQAVPTAVVLPPIPSIDQLQLQGFNQSAQAPTIQIIPNQQSTFFPVMRTGGSG